MAGSNCDTGVCGGDVPPLIGSVLTGTGLTLEQAARRLERGEPLPALTDVQRRIVEDYAVGAIRANSARAASTASPRS